MEKNNRLFFKQNTLFGCLVGASFIIASLLFIFAGKGVVSNPQLNNIMLMLTIFGIFIGTKKYRDDQLSGRMTYAQALTAGIYILAVAALCNAIYTFILYSLDAELLAEYKKIMLAAVSVAYKNTNFMEMYNDAFDKIIFSPFVIAIGEMCGRIFIGAAFTLFIAGLVKKKQAPINPQHF